MYLNFILGSILLIVTFIMTIVLKLRFKISNTYYWMMFPLLHSFTEFIDQFYINTNYLIYLKMHLIFNFGASFILLTAVLKYWSTFRYTYSDLWSLFGFLTFLYLILLSPDSVIISLNENKLSVGIFQTDIFRIFYGFILVDTCIILLIFNYRDLFIEFYKSKYKDFSKLKLLLPIILILFGFSILNGLVQINIYHHFAQFVVVILFLLIPYLLFQFQSFGLRSLFIVDKNGVLIGGYDFKDQLTTFDNKMPQEEVAYFYLTSSFLVALNYFTTSKSEIGKIYEILTERGIYLISNSEHGLIALLTLNQNDMIKEKFKKLSDKIFEYLSNFESLNFSEDLLSKVILDNL